VAATLVGVGMNITFFAIGGKNMVLFPQPSLLKLNGFLVSFIVAGIIFFLVSLVTQPGATEKKSLALFFHPSLDK
jgi:SSS family solute:Na+ symporter